jgi:stage II sporulation protein D
MGRYRERRATGRAAAALLLTVALALTVSTVPAHGVDPTPVPDPAAQQQRLRELRERAAAQREKLGLLDERQAALAEQLDALAAELEALEAAIAAASARVIEVRVTIAGLEAEIAASVTRQRAYETAIGQLSRTLYEASQESSLGRLLNGDLLGFFTQLAYIDRVTGQLTAQVRALERERETEQAAAEAAREERETLEETLRSTALREEELDAQAARVEELLEEMAEAEKEVRKEYALTQTAINTTSLTLEQALKEQAALAAKEQAAGSGSPPPTPSPTAAPTPSPTPAPTDPPSPAPTEDGSTPDPEATPSPTATATATATPAPTPTPAPTALPGTVTFYGRGTDHGVGLSQWGAYGRATAGQGHEEILTHYYRDTSLAPLSTDPRIRVLVANAITPTADRPAKTYGWYGEWSISGRAGPFPAGAYVTMVPSGSSWRAVVRDGAGNVLAELTDAADITLTPGSGATRFQVWFKPSNYDTYRGTIRLIGNNGKVSAINRLLLEEYLWGVVPAEVPASWPAAALRAQAVAARSYAYVHRRSTTTYTFDVHDDTRHQVYLGVLGERTATTNAVNATAKVVVLYGTSVANTLFHATAGGATEHNENVFVSATGARLASPVAYLRGVPDRRPDGTSYDSASNRATWKTATYTLAQLSAIFANDSLTDVGSITAIELSDRGVSGRLITVTLRGTGGTKTVSGPYFKYVFNVYSPATDPAIWSTLFDVAPIP